MLRQFSTVAVICATLSLASTVTVWAAIVPCEGDIQCFAQPTPGYISSTTLIDISGLTDGSSYTSISDRALTVDFDISMKRLTVPDTFATWNCPPATEASCTKPAAPKGLPVLGSDLDSSLIMALRPAAFVFGFEVQPDLSDVEQITEVVFDSKGNDLGGISLDVSGNAGALLFAVSSQTPIVSVQLVDEDFKDFAIANVRYSLTPIPEPPSALLLGVGLVMLAASVFGTRAGASGSMATRAAVWGMSRAMLRYARIAG